MSLLIGRPDEDADLYNFDHPNAIDFDGVHAALLDLLAWKKTQIPIYDFKEHKRYACYELTR